MPKSIHRSCTFDRHVLTQSSVSFIPVWQDCTSRGSTVAEHINEIQHAFDIDGPASAISPSLSPPLLHANPTFKQEIQEAFDIDGPALGHSSHEKLQPELLYLEHIEIRLEPLEQTQQPSTTPNGSQKECCEVCFHRTCCEMRHTSPMRKENPHCIPPPG